MELFLNDACQVSFPGSVVTGALCVRQDHADPCETPIISAKGFTRIRKPGTSRENQEYTIFFQDTAVLITDTDSSHLSSINNELTIGYSKIFIFHFVLPNNLPPSHEVPFGHTRYKITAWFDGNTCKKYFSVNQWVGLEKRNDAVVKSAAYSVSFFKFFRSVKIVLNLKQTHYLPGETVFLGALIKNKSWKDVILSKIYIIQTTKYWENLHILPIKHVRIVAESTRGYIASGSTQVWSQLPLYIPAVIPTTNTSTNAFNYFDIKYTIKIVIRLKNCGKKIKFKQRIFIGNWDKGRATSGDYVNEAPYEIQSKECSIIEMEESGFIPKYMIYETSLD